MSEPHWPRKLVTRRLIARRKPPSITERQPPREPPKVTLAFVPGISSTVYRMAPAPEGKRHEGASAE